MVEERLQCAQQSEIPYQFKQRFRVSLFARGCEKESELRRVWTYSWRVR